jgi:glyoxylase I family protein
VVPAAAERSPVLDEDFPAVPEHHPGFHKVVFVLPGGFVLGLVAHPATDRSHQFDELHPGLDHLSFGCTDRSELEKWQNRLDELGIEHGRHRRGRLRLRLALP